MPSDLASAPPLERSLKQVLGSIATQLDADMIGAGGMASLRRLDPTMPPVAPALHRLLVRHAGRPPSLLEMQHWTLIVHAMALAAPRVRFNKGLGGPLFAAGFSEGRLTRLLESRAPDLPVSVPRAVRFLVAHDQPLDPLALSWFVRGIAGGGRSAEEQRTRVAHDYYRAEYAETRTSSPAGSAA